ncbi:hypothetical protein C7293_16875 [filamentous cyanobacterium CCT1]|nr:hypothetical protein C7293_16875 [filamentous cyanobacterium CCT1]PSN79965.1 hypothetical protein C8B47_08920 [filamentous cyanobacterium CCP4]
MNLFLLFGSVRLATPFCRKRNLYLDAITLFLLALGFTSSCQASAQTIPIPDNTLGEENSRVNALSPNIDSIDGGALRGNSLFHSFLEFNIDENRGVFFFGPSGVENIFSRVTGAGSPSNPNVSNILGVLGTFGDSSPNLYLLNPNGIIFGPNSRLAVTGSFFATSADEVRFGEQGVFSTLAVSLPARLLTVAPSAFLFNQTKPGDIVSQSNTLVGVTSGGFPLLGLRVPDGESLTLLGGNVTIDGGNSVLNGTAVLSGLTARNGRVEVGSVGSVGLVEIEVDGSLLFEPNTSRADINLLNRSIINNASSGVGNIALTARNINLASQSFLLTGIESGAIASESQSGGIQLNASENVRISEQSNINSIVGGTGNEGEIEIKAGSLFVIGGGQIATTVVGSGTSGNIVIDVEDRVILEGRTEDGRVPSGILSTVELGGRGVGGSITLNARSLESTGGGQIVASTRGNGNSGNIVLDITEEVFFDGSGIITGTQPLSGVFNNVESNATGNGGFTQIYAGTLEFVNGAQISAGTFGTGNASDVILEVDGAAIFRGINDNGLFAASGVLAPVGDNVVGNGGNIQIRSSSLDILDGARIVSSALGGQGNAGNINLIVVGPFKIESQLSNGEVFAAGRSALNEDINLIESGQPISFVGSFTGPGAIGNGGDIEISANTLTVLNGAQLISSTLGEGNAGDIIIKIRDLAIFDGFNTIDEKVVLQSSVFTSVERSAIGDGGNILLEAESMRLTNGGTLNARSLGNGLAGNITVLLRDALEANNGLITTASAFSSGGQISIEADWVALEDNSDIVSQVLLGQGKGGDISLVANAILAFSDSDILAFAQDGQGGNIILDTRAFFGENYQPAPSGTDPLTLDGNGRVNINASGAVSGVITSPDVSFIENSLTSLPDTVVDTDRLIAGSCIARTDTGGSFIVSGRGGLPDRPSETFTAPYSTGSIRPLPTDDSATVEENGTVGWQPGDPIVEPEGLFQLPDGRLVASRTCSFN